MAYKLSERFNQDGKIPTSEDINFSVIVKVLIVFGIISLFTAFIFSIETGEIASKEMKLSLFRSDSMQVGPFDVNKNNQSLKVSFKIDLQSQSWTVVSGKVLNENKEYLFSFSKELSYYSGRDSEGSWSELDDSYSMSLTFPKKGKYYLDIDLEFDRKPSTLKVWISKKLGSHIPHMIFGILLVILAIIINEVKNQTISKMIIKANQNE